MGEKKSARLKRRVSEAVARRCFVKKGVLENFAKLTGKHLCQSPFFAWGLQLFLKNETLAQTFFCEFCEIFKYTFFLEHLRRLLLKFQTFAFNWILIIIYSIRIVRYVSNSIAFPSISIHIIWSWLKDLLLEEFAEKV